MDKVFRQFSRLLAMGIVPVLLAGCPEIPGRFGADTVATPRVTPSALPAATQAGIWLQKCSADLCNANGFPWTLTKTADTSGVVNGSGTVVWTIDAVKGDAAGVLTVTGSITVRNTRGGTATIGNVVVNLQKFNTRVLGFRYVPFISVAADVADATRGDAAAAKIVAAGSIESQPFNSSYGAKNYSVSGAAGTFIETAGSGALTFTDATGNPLALSPAVSGAPGARLTFNYAATFNTAALDLAANTAIDVEALVSFANAGARLGSGAAAPNIDVDGNGVIDASEGPAPIRVRTVPCRTLKRLPAAAVGNDSVTLSDTETDISVTGATVANFATDIGGGTGVEVINASATRTVSVDVTCSGTSSGELANTAHIDGAGSACSGAPIALDATSAVPIACISTAYEWQDGDFITYAQND